MWWFSTGVILYLDGLPRRTFRWTWPAPRPAGRRCSALAATRGRRRAGPAPTARSPARCWSGAGIEVAFLTGLRDRPAHARACPPGARGWRRARYAFEAILYHELAICSRPRRRGRGDLGRRRTRSAPGPSSCCGSMRASAKLNVFLGVRNLGEDFLPEHLRYLQTYFTRRPMNLLFPVSVSVGTVVAVLLWIAALADATAPVRGHGPELRRHAADAGRARALVPGPADQARCAVGLGPGFAAGFRAAGDEVGARGRRRAQRRRGIRNGSIACTMGRRSGRGRGFRAPPSPPRPRSRVPSHASARRTACPPACAQAWPGRPRCGLRAIRHAGAGQAARAAAAGTVRSCRRRRSAEPARSRCRRALPRRRARRCRRAVAPATSPSRGSRPSSGSSPWLLSK